MKTLDEVIKALEYCQNPADDLGNCKEECPYIHNCDPECTAVKADALHYLKAFRDAEDALWICKEDKDDLTALRAFWKEQHDNHPLDWDELKKMSGKPVWVEWIDGPWKGNSKWVLIERVAELMAIFTAIDACGVNYNGNLHNLSMGTQWQAYRKEQNEDDTNGLETL